MSPVVQESKNCCSSSHVQFCGWWMVGWSSRIRIASLFSAGKQLSFTPLVKCLGILWSPSGYTRGVKLPSSATTPAIAGVGGGAVARWWCLPVLVRRVHIPVGYWPVRSIWKRTDFVFKLLFSIFFFTSLPHESKSMQQGTNIPRITSMKSVSNLSTRSFGRTPARFCLYAVHLFNWYTKKKLLLTVLFVIIATAHDTLTLTDGLHLRVWFALAGWRHLVSNPAASWNMIRINELEIYPRNNIQYCLWNLFFKRWLLRVLTM